MNNSFNVKPLYVQVLDALTQRLVSGEWKPGTLLKNEIDLSREYGVSVGTMRKALEELERMRVITRKQGRGSYVSDQVDSAHHARYDNVRDFANNQVEDRVTSTTIEQVVADGAARENLQLEVGDTVFRCQQVRRGGTKAIAFEEAMVPAALFTDLIGSQSYSLATASKRNGQIPGEAIEKVYFQAPTKLASAALNLKPATKVAVFDRIVLNIAQRPIEWRRVWTELEDRYYLARIA